MFSYQDFLTLKEEKLLLERENIRLKHEILEMTQKNDEILPKSTFLLEQLRDQNKEKESKIKSLEVDIFNLRKQIVAKNKNDLKEKNIFLSLMNKSQKDKIESLKTQYKQQLSDFMQKNKQNSGEIHDLKSTIAAISTQMSKEECEKMKNENQQLKNTIQILDRKYKTHKYKQRKRNKN